MADGTSGGAFSQTVGIDPDSGNGGNIALTAGQSVTISDSASVSASSTGPGNAGNISINAGQQFEMRNSSVKTEAAQASGGEIDIRAMKLVRLVDSTISTSVLGGAGSGGNITIDPNIVVLQNSNVIAIAVQGAGGNITITTPLFLADSTSLVSASSQFGLNGTVTIQSPTSNLSESLGTLTSTPSQAQSLVTQRCAALANGQTSSFVVAGREQLPADPGSWLTSPLALAGLDADPFKDGTVAEGTSNLAPRTSGLLANDRVSLRRLTPAGFLIANFADSEATGCHS
jgi:large exoprotein involved in heme utilization and adhesion